MGVRFPLPQLMIEIKTNGVTRLVILTKNYAIKIPNFCRGWRMFLHGLICNMHEKMFSDTKWEQLCPIVFAVWGGWLVVMKRARPLTDEEWNSFDCETFVKEPNLIPVETKRCSFGVLNGKIVAVDYG